MASVTIGGGSVIVHGAPVFGDQTFAVPTGPVSGLIVVDPNQSLPQAEAHVGVASVGGAFVAVAASPDGQAVQIRAGGIPGVDQNTVVGAGSSPVSYDTAGGIYQFGVGVGGAFVAVAASPDGQAVQVREGDPQSGGQNTVIGAGSAPVSYDTTGGIYQVGVGTGDAFVAVAVNPQGQGAQVREGDPMSDGQNTVIGAGSAPASYDTAGGIYQAGVVLPTGNYLAVAVNPDAQGAQVRVGDSNGDQVNQVFYAPSGGGVPGFPPELPVGPGDLPSVPGGGGGFPPALPVGPGDLPTGLGGLGLISGTGADTVVAPGAAAMSPLSLGMANSSILGAGALSTVDPFAAANGGGLVNLGADSMASSQLAGAFVQDPALHQLVAPAVVDTHAPATGSVLSLDDGLTTIQLHGIDHKHS